MSHHPLHTPMFQPLLLNEIKPTGWLRQQLRIQADSLSGNLDEFWPDIRDSGWIGGKAEGWERMPYWLDGVVPLAFLLDDVVLQAKCRRYLEYIVDHQAADGWLGPRPANPAHFDAWGVILLLKPLMQYADATGNARYQEAIARNLELLNRWTDAHPVINWAHSRWFEALIPIFWLYEKTHEGWLLGLAHKLAHQGADWKGVGRAELYRHRTAGYAASTQLSHVVNNAMAIKAYGLVWRLTGSLDDRLMPGHFLSYLDRYHGQVHGMCTGDEHLAGKNPAQGTELCAIVEAMYSLEVLAALFGEISMIDRLEKLTFNALPATFSPDMWSHQYDQQVNQVECSEGPNRPWTTNDPDSNLFGLEPNYGCCTANLSQGWPKFATHLWMRSRDNGLAALAYAPCTVRTLIGTTPVHIAVETEYPFRHRIELAVTVDQPATFPIHLRIPEWARGSRVTINGQAAPAPAAGSFYKIAREWSGTTRVTLSLPMTPRLSRRYNNAAVIERGPLVYSLRITENWHQVHKDRPGRQQPHADWEIYALSPWNYALSISENNVEQIPFKELPVGAVPFSPEGAPVSATVQAYRLPDWHIENGHHTALPHSPVKSVDSRAERVTLIPYGCTNLRVTEFPTVDENLVARAKASQPAPAKKPAVKVSPKKPATKKSATRKPAAQRATPAKKANKAAAAKKSAKPVAKKVVRKTKPAPRPKAKKPTGSKARATARPKAVPRKIRRK